MNNILHAVLNATSDAPVGYGFYVYEWRRRMIFGVGALFASLVALVRICRK